MTLAAHLILDTGAIVFSRSHVPAPGQILIGMGHDKAWQRAIFRFAEICGAKVYVPGWRAEDPEAERWAALAEFQGTLISAPSPPQVPPAAIGSHPVVSPSESRQQRCAGRGG